MWHKSESREEGTSVDELPLDWLVGMSVWHCWLMWEGPALKGGGPERSKEGSWIWAWEQAREQHSFLVPASALTWVESLMGQLWSECVSQTNTPLPKLLLVSIFKSTTIDIKRGQRLTLERGILLQLTLTTVFFWEDCGSTLNFGLDMPLCAENLKGFAVGDGKLRMLREMQTTEAW